MKPGGSRSVARRPKPPAGTTRKTHDRGAGSRSRDVLPPRVHRHTLVEMNRPVYSARRDAAHARVLILLRDEVRNNPKTARTRLYRACVRLLDDAITATERSQIQPESSLIHYLRLLSETVSAMLALVEHECRLAREASKFSSLLGAELIAELQSTSDVFSQSELHVLDCIGNLLRFGEPLLTRDRDERMAAFTPDDRRRYDVALREYRDVYGRLS